MGKRPVNPADRLVPCYSHMARFHILLEYNTDTYSVSFIVQIFNTSLQHPSRGPVNHAPEIPIILHAFGSRVDSRTGGTGRRWSSSVDTRPHTYYAATVEVQYIQAHLSSLIQRHRRNNTARIVDAQFMPASGKHLLH